MGQGQYSAADLDTSTQGQTGQYSASDLDAASPTKRTWLDSAADFGKELWNQVNPVSGVKGAAQLTAHPIQTYMADAGNRQQILDKANAAFKRGDYAEGVAHSLYGIIPFLGPQLERAGENFQQGNIAKGAGASVGMGLALAGPEGVKNLALEVPGARALAQKMYQSALKPSTTLSSAEKAEAINTGLENELPISASGQAKLADLVSDLNQNVQAQIEAGSKSGATVNKFAVTSRLGNTANKFATQVNPEADLNAVSGAGNEFLRNQPNEIPAAEAQAIKSGTYKQLGSKAYGELSSATVESQKALARGIKEELQQQFPEIQGLNAQEAKLLNLDPLLERAVNRIGNRNIVSLGGKVTTVAGAAAGGAPGAAIAGVLHEVLSWPELQSKLAIALNRASKGSVSIGAARARILGYTTALGNAAAINQPQVANATAGP